jgi:hypothetical protein
MARKLTGKGRFMSAGWYTFRYSILAIAILGMCSASYAQSSPDPTASPSPPPPQISRSKAVDLCVKEVLRQNNFAGSSNNSVDHIGDVYPQGSVMVVEGLYSVTRSVAGDVHGSFRCEYNGKWAKARVD